jgi:arylsulfatase A-like enzyme
MSDMNRRQFLKAVGVGAAALSVGRLSAMAASAPEAQGDRPNIILAMTDDQGWGDVSYNGLKKIKTPNLDAMAAAGVRFNRFYSAHPSCSPTRASVMTGRHPFRTGTIWPGMPLRTQEFTIAQAIKRVGYTTGHFGKWHLSGGKSGAGRALSADDPLHPGRFGFDTWFTVSNWFDTNWTFSRMGEKVTVPGDGSDAIVAEALTFIKKNAESKTPFLALIWFGSPHIPLSPTKEDLEAAGGHAYYGEMIGVDRSMGALRDGLRKLGIADNTMLWFNSDNGAWQDEQQGPDAFGSNGILRGHKGQIWEGGIRVPGLIEWPARIKKPFVSDVPVVTSDIYPTIVDLLKIDTSDHTQPIDGISILAILDRKIEKRPKGIGFWHPEDDEILASTQVAWIDNQYKLHKRGEDKFELYDLIADVSEQTDVAAGHPDIVKRMKADMEAWQQSVARSFHGEDYPEGKVIPSPKQPKA